MRTVITSGHAQRLKAQFAVAMSEVILSHAMTWQIKDKSWKAQLEKVLRWHTECLKSLNRFPLVKDHRNIIDRKVKKVAPYIPSPSAPYEEQADAWAGLADFTVSLIDDVHDQCVDYGTMPCWRFFRQTWETLLRGYMYAGAKDPKAVEVYGHPLGGRLYLSI